jgi:hypothetical protein
MWPLFVCGRCLYRVAVCMGLLFTRFIFLKGRMVQLVENVYWKAGIQAPYPDQTYQMTLKLEPNATVLKLDQHLARKVAFSKKWDALFSYVFHSPYLSPVFLHIFHSSHVDFYTASYAPSIPGNYKGGQKN